VGVAGADLFVMFPSAPSSRTVTEALADVFRLFAGDWSNSILNDVDLVYDFGRRNFRCNASEQAQ
jgi:hypothetical protein